ncbi:uncharacterized protein METZ01_LOCUS19891 [marine metagenome]|uniref:UDP-N-acetylmuramate:L-alanyl-gamma-D-glutamyl-meso-diaminopimelate ligase n=1 Tax=marine metagenome TaxID=408172 RepID=A0A381PLK7_9ZZZZ
MAGIASLAKAKGHDVTGSDLHFYPPMSYQLKNLGIKVIEGYDANQLSPPPDCVLVGNALSRGNDLVEALLNSDIHFQSGPEWLAENVLKGRKVVAIAGTHGKTTVASMLAWILEDAGLSPGFLIGGIPCDFGISTAMGESEYFVLEADEYDTAFFDKRAKFLLYHPHIVVLNNLEYDHADIYDDIEHIKSQFHKLIRTIPSNGHIILNGEDKNLSSVIKMGCWTPMETFGIREGFDWVGEFSDLGGRNIRIKKGSHETVESPWNLSGEHNLENALAAISSAYKLGVSLSDSLKSLSKFSGVKRRLEKTATISNISIYDDFAHHPTAIRRTIVALKKQNPNQRVIVALELRSNTMKMGLHNKDLVDALVNADFVVMFAPSNFDSEVISSSLGSKIECFSNYNDLIFGLENKLNDGDQVVFMSNGSFGGVREVLTKNLQKNKPGEGDYDET